MASAATPGESELLLYSRGAIWFHWIIAALVVANLLIGFFHEDFDKAARTWMMFFHKSFGLTVLALSLGRLIWRLRHRPPAFDPVLRAWERSLARATQWLFYALMIAIPLTGWLLVSSAGRATSYFGLFEIGALPVAQGDAAKDGWESVHKNLGIAMITLIALHVAGALKHHFEGHKHLIGRMAPWAYRRR